MQLIEVLQVAQGLLEQQVVDMLTWNVYRYEEVHWMEMDLKLVNENTTLQIKSLQNLNA